MNDQDLPETREEILVWKLSLDLSSTRTLMSRANRGLIPNTVYEIMLWSRRIEKKFPDLVHYENFNIFRNEYKMFIAGVPARIVKRDRE